MRNGVFFIFDNCTVVFLSSHLLPGSNILVISDAHSCCDEWFVQDVVLARAQFRSPFLGCSVPDLWGSLSPVVLLGALVFSVEVPVPVAAASGWQWHSGPPCLGEVSVLSWPCCPTLPLAGAVNPTASLLHAPSSLWPFARVSQLHCRPLSPGHAETFEFFTGFPSWERTTQEK